MRASTVAVRKGQTIAKYTTLAEVFGAFQTGALDRENQYIRLVLDNDSWSLSAPDPDKNGEYETVFEIDPSEGIIQALGLLNIPWEYP